MQTSVGLMSQLNLTPPAVSCLDTSVPIKSKRDSLLYACKEVYWKYTVKKTIKTSSP